MLKPIYMAIILSMAVPAYAIDVKTYIPEKAIPLLPLIKTESTQYFPTLTTPAYFAALIEHESCISLTHSRCWSPTSQLKTKRELGIGIGQLTKAYTQTGKLRFDALQEMKQRHSELKELNWNTIKARVDLQARAIILMTKDNHKALYNVKDEFQRLAMTDAAYNGGLGGVFKERRVCGLTKGCDPQFWFNHVARTCMKSKKVLYGNRSACDINRNHVTDVLLVRYNKYLPWFK